MQHTGWIGVIFVAAAVIFVAATLQNYLQEQGQLTAARKAWLRIALIFSAIGIGLHALDLLLP